MTISIKIESTAGVNVNSGSNNYLDAVPSMFAPKVNNFGYFYKSITDASAYGLAEDKEGTVFSGGAALLAKGQLAYDISVHVVTGRLDFLALGEELNGLSGGFGQTSTKVSLGRTDVSFSGLGLDAKNGDDVNGILYGMMTGDADNFLALLKTTAVKFTGGAGDDEYAAGSKNDVLNGGAGTDLLYGGKGNDILDGGKGSDMLSGETGNDTYAVDNGSDEVVEKAGGGTDLVKAAITYSLTNYVENLTLTGSGNINGTGNGLVNTITGNAGRNTLTGAGGADHLIGGKGVDKLYGGADADSFVFHTGDSGKTHAAADTIYDFAGTDSIDLTGWDANSKAKGVQDFGFIGTQAFTRHVGELHFVKAASDTWIEGDTNGDGKADFTIHLDDAFNLKAAHFDL